MYLLRELQKYIEPTRIAKIKDWSSNVSDNVDQLELFLYIADEYVKCYKTVWQLLKKLYIPHYLAISLLGIHFKKICI